jgi:hypothetical protein
LVIASATRCGSVADESICTTARPRARLTFTSRTPGTERAALLDVRDARGAVHPADREVHFIGRGVMLGGDLRHRGFSSFKESRKRKANFIDEFLARFCLHRRVRRRILAAMVHTAVDAVLDVIGEQLHADRIQRRSHAAS